jgi:glutathione S-transferase
MWSIWGKKNFKSSQEPNKMSVNYSLNYFNKVGKIELVRLMFAAADVQYTDNFIEKLTDKDLQLGCMPFLRVNSENCQIPCISVVSRYLAREFKLAGESSIQQAKTDAIAQSVMLLIDSYYRNVMDEENFDVKKINLKNYLENDCVNAGLLIEKLVEQYCENSRSEGRVICKGQCVGASLTYADLFVYEMVSKYFPQDCDELPQRFPNLYKVRETVEQIQQIQNFNKTNRNQTPRLSKDAVNDLSNE